jgi:hypothetical protein
MARPDPVSDPGDPNRVPGPPLDDDGRAYPVNRGAITTGAGAGAGAEHEPVPAV